MGYAETFKALSDPVRREILLMLREGKMSAGDIGKKFDLSAATISHHLSLLKNADLIFEEKYKNYIYYELSTSVFEDIMMWVTQFKGELHDVYEKQKINEETLAKASNKI